MRESDIYLAGFLQCLRLDEHRILPYFTQDPESEIRTSKDLLLARQEFQKRFPEMIHGYLMRTALVLSESFRSTVLREYNPKRDWVESRVFWLLGRKFNSYIRQIRTESMKLSRFLGYEINSAIYLERKYWRAEQLTIEALIWHWVSLTDTPRDLEGLKFFLSRMLGANNRIDGLVERLCNLTECTGIWARAQIRIQLLPELLNWFKWLTVANPIDRFTQLTRQDV